MKVFDQEGNEAELVLFADLKEFDLDDDEEDDETDFESDNDEEDDEDAWLHDQLSDDDDWDCDDDD